MRFSRIFATLGCRLVSMKCVAPVSRIPVRFQPWKVLGGLGTCVATVQAQGPANCGKGEGKSMMFSKTTFREQKSNSSEWRMSQSPAKPSSAHQTNTSDNAPSESSSPWPSALAHEQPAYSSDHLIPPWHAGDGSGQKGKNRLSVQLTRNDSLDDGKKRKTKHAGDSQLVLYLKGGERQNIQETKQMI